MSGHSKWKTIQHKKGAADAKRGKVFSRISKELMVAAREGGGNPDTNPGLRTMMLKARAANMPADNIDRAVKKGTGELEGMSLEEVVYECYAPGGVGLIVVALTDNKNRATAEVRHIFTKHGTNFAGQGAVARSFKRKGNIVVNVSAVEEDKLMDIILEAGAEDMTQEDGRFEIVTDPSSFAGVVEALEAAGIQTESAEVTLLPDVYVPVSDKKVAQQILRLTDDLEDNDDVQNVYTNVDIDEGVLKELAAEESGD
jgi:YebC/PmpR family DNA-binding regulatory protein